MSSQGLSSSPVSPSSLVTPGQALHDAAPVLRVVATFIEQGDLDAARIALFTIDATACHRYWVECAQEGLRRHVDHEGRSKARRTNVSSALKMKLGERDGWRCGYCGLRVVHPGFFRALYGLYPADFPQAKGSAIEGTAWPFQRVFDASPDHVVPVSAGGEHTEANLVTSCGACNYQMKGSCTLDELGL